MYYIESYRTTYSIFGNEKGGIHITIDRLYKLRSEVETMIFLCKHDVNLKKVYSDINFYDLIFAIDDIIFAYNLFNDSMKNDS